MFVITQQKVRAEDGEEALYYGLQHGEGTLRADAVCAERARVQQMADRLNAAETQDEVILSEMLQDLITELYLL